MTQETMVGMQGGVANLPDDSAVESGWEWPTPEDGTPPVGLSGVALSHMHR
jgi:hypothetical protein